MDWEGQRTILPPAHGTPSVCKNCGCKIIYLEGMHGSLDGGWLHDEEGNHTMACLGFMAEPV